jgi:hypothetical protein
MTTVSNVLKKSMIRAVTEIVGKPHFSRFEILSDADFEAEVPQDSGDRLTGGTAAITIGNDILVREGYEDSAIHELVHAAGMKPIRIGYFINEGITQYVANLVADKLGMKIRPSYRDATHFVQKKILPLIGDERNFIKGYAEARDKGKFVVDSIWNDYSDAFSNIADWGKNPYKGLLQAIPYTLGASAHLDYLIDEWL